MMELNRERIVTALENAVRLGKFYSYMTPKLSYEELRDAIALIRELTEENERLRGVGLPDYSTYIRLSDAKTAIMAYIGEQTVSKYASQVECKAARSGAEGAMNELDYITPAQVAPVADTVRKMQDRLKAKIHDSVYQYWNFGSGGYYLAEDVDEDIDQIAKEIMEE
jgi:hypothetical protein